MNVRKTKPEPPAEVDPLGSAPDSHGRRRVLVVEPDALTQWALKNYLQRWFLIESTGSVEEARNALERQRIDKLVIADELPAEEVRALERRASNLNANLEVVRLLGNPSTAYGADTDCTTIEKPFELARLAVLLGVSEHDLPRED